MLEIKFVRQNLSLVQEALKNRNTSADLEIFQKSDEDRREILAQVES
jgi:seryl-tRNA synthetase